MVQAPRPTVPDPRFPWILMLPGPGGTWNVWDNRAPVEGGTQEQALVRTEAELAAFIAQHSAAPGYGGLGDAVRGVTKKLGFGECTPCAKRQAMLNGLMPRVFRRR